WSAFYMSEAAWAFISGILFYLMILGYFAFELARNFVLRKSYKNVEMLPEVNEDGQIMGRAPRDRFHFNKKGKMLHPVVHMHVFNPRGEIFLQYRPPYKDVQPDKWDTAVGGHVSFGETIEEALKRETFEEIGLTDYKPVFLAKYTWETDVEKELVYMFMTVTGSMPVINPGELADGKFWSADDVMAGKKSGRFTPNFMHEFDMMQRNSVIR
ncbi:MAG TPA: NUDIX domain-containing protein, partial [Bacteroidales bacterium]|nr:NUDIX domain-containing protein [Bacteroidales bacterium]